PIDSKQEVIVDDHTSTNPGADGHVKYVMMSPRGTKAPFSECRKICIITQQNGDIKFIPKLLTKRKVDPSGNIGGGIHNPCARVQITWRSNSHGADMGFFRP